jgi:hypothetical protein
MRRHLSASLFALLIIAGTFSPLPGQPPSSPSGGFAVGPLEIVLKGRPGATVQGKFTVVAPNTNEATKYSIDVTDLGQDSSGARTAVAIGKGARSCANWIRIDRELTVPPRGRIVVPVSVVCPADCRGGYYACIYVRYLPKTSAEQMVVVLQPAVTIRVELDIPGPAPLHLDVRELSLASSRAGSPDEIVLKVANTGVWKTSVEGDILLYPPAGGFPIRVALPFTKSGEPMEVYPGLDVTLRCPMNTSPPAARYKALARLVMNGKWQARSQFDLDIPVRSANTSLAGKLQSKSEYDLALWVEPDLVELSMPAGASRVVPIKIQNQDTRTAVITAEVSSVRTEASGLLTFPERAAGPKWITISPDSLSLGPGRMTTIQARVAMPEETQNAVQNVGAIRIRASTPGVKDGWTSAGDFGVLVVASNPQAKPPEIAIAGPRLVRPSADKNPTAAVFNVTNTGQRAARLSGSVRLERASGQTIATMAIGGERPEPLVGGATRELRMPIGPLDQGKFRVVAEISTAGDKTPAKRAEAEFESVTTMPAGIE